MAIRKMEHLAIAVKDLQKSRELFGKLLGKEAYKTEKVDSQGVETVFFMLGETKIELLGSLNEKNAVEKFIKKKGEGMHHFALAVDNIAEETERLKKEGFEFLYDEPQAGADNKIINFIHPKSTGGILIELCQEKK